MTGTSIQNWGGQETKSKSSSTIINDGKFMYTISDEDGEKSAFKTKTDPKAGGDLIGDEQGIISVGESAKAGKKTRRMDNDTGGALDEGFGYNGSDLFGVIFEQ